MIVELNPIQASTADLMLTRLAGWLTVNHRLVDHAEGQHEDLKLGGRLGKLSLVLL